MPEEAESTEEEKNQQKAIAEGASLWKIGDEYHLVYFVPDHPDVPLTWKIEDEGRIEAIWGEAGKAPDRTLDPLEFLSLNPWYGGLSAELRDTDEDPWQQFMSDYLQALNVRPWLSDPTMLATVAVAFLEGREPTRDELSQTDWWNNSTQAERQWLETSVTAGTAEVERMRQDMRLTIDQTLRGVGMDTSSQSPLVDWITDKALTGKWSQEYLGEQMKRLVDPMAGQMDSELESFVAEQRFAPETTRSGEDEVSQLARKWLGPTMGNLSMDEKRDWAGRIRNDPDAKVEYEAFLKQQRFAMLPTYENIDLSYEDIVSPYRRLAADVWGRVPTDESMLIDLANLNDVSAAQARLRKTGLEQGVEKVVRDSIGSLEGQSLGQRVVRSAV